jgi:hypothetical protein
MLDRGTCGWEGLSLIVISLKALLAFDPQGWLSVERFYLGQDCCLEERLCLSDDGSLVKWLHLR